MSENTKIRAIITGTTGMVGEGVLHECPHHPQVEAILVVNTENDLMKLPFKQVYALPPGFIQPTKGLKNMLSFYKYLGWLYPVGHAVFPRFFCLAKGNWYGYFDCVICADVLEHT